MRIEIQQAGFMGNYEWIENEPFGCDIEEFSYNASKEQALAFLSRFKDGTFIVAKRNEE